MSVCGRASRSAGQIRDSGQSSTPPAPRAGKRGRRGLEHRPPRPGPLRPAPLPVRQSTGHAERPGGTGARKPARLTRSGRASPSGPQQSTDKGGSAARGVATPQRRGLARKGRVGRPVVQATGGSEPGFSESPKTWSHGGREVKESPRPRRTVKSGQQPRCWRSSKREAVERAWRAPDGPGLREGVASAGPPSAEARCGEAVLLSGPFVSSHTNRAPGGDKGRTVVNSAAAGAAKAAGSGGPAALQYSASIPRWHRATAGLSAHAPALPPRQSKAALPASRLQ